MRIATLIRETDSSASICTCPNSLARVSAVKHVTIKETEPKIFRYTCHLQKKRKDVIRGSEWDMQMVLEVINYFRQIVHRTSIHFDSISIDEIKPSLGNQSYY